MATSHISSSFTSSRILPVSRLHPVPRRSRVLTVKAKIREIFMLALSSAMIEGKIVSWTKSEGDQLSKGESMVVVESD
ncbi:Dihydrolipoyllysine-residue acetyltransferase component 5 of pyruvate dehydrogenase [Carex littledalei]|uniref:Dihydrolipoyllysine-residue acetyltransferase component 5 of pyruvate dehydrogenase n=1 Tax=Carex littledalei TaxID=544730 RepID=A0A833QLJ3_9POAL|nr:Dihydrolipoyllysine-residue acetyltransferase component 5 of pyruvate dehydrogenase [Carex littledalei]